MRELTKRSEAEAVDVTLTWLDERTIALPDATAILGTNAAFVTQCICGRSDASVHYTLLDELGRHHPESIVSLGRGFWLKTHAGWGRVIGIEQGKTAVERVWTRDLTDAGCRLKISLRDQEEDAELV